MPDAPETWDLWVDFHRVDSDGLTHASIEDATSGAVIDAGRYIVVGDYNADPAVAHVVDVSHDGIVLLRVLPGHANAHLELVDRRPA